MAEAVAPWTARPLGGALRVLPDRRLVGLAKRGDRAALAAICCRYQQPLYRYCQAILHNPEEARDALQNTFMSVLRNLPGEQREIELKPWLYRIAHNESISVIRQRREAEPLDSAALVETVAPDIEVRQELQELVGDLQSLGERQRGALVMRELGGLSFDEIGAAFATSSAAARQAVYEARVALQDQKQGRAMGCDEVQIAISAGDGRVLRGRRVRAHLRDCAECRDFRAAISDRREGLAMLAPPMPAIAAAGVLHSVFGAGVVGGASSAGGAAGLVAGAAGKSAAASLAAKAAAVAAAAVVVGGGAATVTGVVHPFGDSAKHSTDSSSSGVSGEAAGHASAGAERSAAGSSTESGGTGDPDDGTRGSHGHHRGGGNSGNGNGNGGGNSASAQGQTPPGTLPSTSNGHGVASHGKPATTPASPNGSSSAGSQGGGPPTSAPGNSGNTPSVTGTNGNSANTPGAAGTNGNSANTPSAEGTSNGNSASNPSSAGSTPSASAPGQSKK